MLRVLALCPAVVLAGCGSSSDGRSGGFAGECQTPFDCEPRYVCIPSEYDGVIPPSVAEGVPGVCELKPELVSFVYIGLAAGSSSSDGFVVEPGLYRWGMRYRNHQFGTTTGASYELELPYSGGPLGLSVDYGLESYIRVVGVDDPSFDVECNLAFNEAGELVEGGVVLGPGEHGEYGRSFLLVCPTSDSGNPGIWIEGELWE